MYAEVNILKIIFVSYALPFLCYKSIYQYSSKSYIKRQHQVERQGDELNFINIKELAEGKVSQ